MAYKTIALPTRLLHLRQKLGDIHSTQGKTLYKRRKHRRWRVVPATIPNICTSSGPNCTHRFLCSHNCRWRPKEHPHAVQAPAVVYPQTSRVSRWRSYWYTSPMTGGVPPLVVGIGDNQSGVRRGFFSPTVLRSSLRSTKSPPPVLYRRL
jgi:hypothetical protein